MSEKDLVKENNRLREKLDPHNKKIYEKILIYIRTSYKTKSNETEEILNELLFHVLDAQRNAKNIESVTGENLKAYADSIVEALPKRNIWKYAGIIAALLAGFNFIFDYLLSLIFMAIDGAPLTTTINILESALHLIILISLGILLVFTVFKTLQYVLFKNWFVWQEYGLYFIIAAAFFTLFSALISLVSLIDIGPSFEVSMWLPVSLGVILLIIGFTLLFNPRDNA